MNNYLDYYNYMNNFNPDMNYEHIKSPTQNNNNVSLCEPYQGFTRGNMFKNTYIPYKNYKPFELNPKNEQEYDMLLLQTYAFATDDLNLYLDVNPNDTRMINQRNEYLNLYKQALNNYERKYGPITTTTIIDKNTYSWDTKKWPWEGEK